MLKNRKNNKQSIAFQRKIITLRVSPAAAFYIQSFLDPEVLIDEWNAEASWADDPQDGDTDRALRERVLAELEVARKAFKRIAKPPFPIRVRYPRQAK